MSQTFRMVILVSGRGSNMTSVLEALKNKTLHGSVECVISNKAHAKALEVASDFNIPTQVIESKNKAAGEFQKQILHALQTLQPDLIILAGFMKILSAPVIEAFSQKIINIHPSLLPKFPGLDAQKQALEAGEAHTGCTVHYVDEGCDTGPIILHKTEEILPTDTVDTLSKRLLKKEHKCLIEAIQLIQKQHFSEQS